MAVPAVRGLALCAGAGGLELGVRLALGAGYRTVAYVERDPFAAAVLVARMADQALDQAPVWDDVATFDGRPWRGRVDLVTAGFPCPPFSAAGQRRGVEDDRWLWPDIARVVREVSPRLVFLEQVPGLLVPAPDQLAGLGHVLRDLAALGFDAEWSLLSAADLGATHRRARLWVLAHRDGSGLPILGWQSPDHGHPRDDADRPGRTALADTSSSRLATQPRGSDGRKGAHARGPENADHLADGPGQALAGPDDQHLQGDEGGHLAAAGAAGGGPAVADTGVPGRQGVLPWPHEGRPGSQPPSRDLLWPPGPDDHASWRHAITEGRPEPAVRGVADGLAHRVDRLHTTGNGVVALVAGYAFVRLAQRADLIRSDEVTA